MDKAQALVKELLELPEGYSVLFLQGGASLEFVMAPYNLLKKGGKAAYLDTGSWSAKAIKEAEKFGETVVVASSKDKGYSYIPKDYEIPSDADYIHFTSNNTIFGTQMQNFPDSPVPMICDMSSDIFSRKIDFSAFSLIYAGAQKNMGPAGTTLVVVKKEILNQVSRHIPTMLDYNTHINKGSMFNTPSVFAVYGCLQTLKWIDGQGLEEIENYNNIKADLIYSEIDQNDMFEGTTAIEDRSIMNATFVLKEERLNDAFLNACNEANISGLKGHRSVGGFRASIYNAMRIESVKVLVDVMRNFK